VSCSSDSRKIVASRVQTHTAYNTVKYEILSSHSGIDVGWLAQSV
jgi:hypothetical protein